MYVLRVLFDIIEKDCTTTGVRAPLQLRHADDDGHQRPESTKTYRNGTEEYHEPVTAPCSCVSWDVENGTPVR